MYDCTSTQQVSRFVFMILYQSVVFERLDFVRHVPLVFDMDGLSPELMKDVCKSGLVIDSEMRDIYMAPLFQACPSEKSKM